MTIEQFLRGCFDCGYEASVTLHQDGNWYISAYDGGDVYTSRYKAGEGPTFDCALADFEAAGWRPSAKEAIAAAQRAGGWTAEEPS